MIPIAWPQPVLVSLYGAVAAAMVITALILLPLALCFERGRSMVRTTAPSQA